MSEAIKHECGIALLRLRKPLAYYQEKYKTPAYALNKLYLLMEKQHNRGQDGAGVANIKLNMPPGKQYLFRSRSVAAQPLPDIFKKIQQTYQQTLLNNPDGYYDAAFMKAYQDFTGELWLGHLRYGTHGLNGVENCHPHIRSSNWRSRTLVMAGNFNMTNVDDLFQRLVDLGQHPRDMADTITVMEKIGHFLDEETQRQFLIAKGNATGTDLSAIVESNIDLQRVLQRSCRDFDGGYAMAGLTGYGAAFVARDPSGIRPAYYYIDDEVVVVASEKPAIKTAFNADYAQIKEIKPGHALVIDQAGDARQVQFIETQPRQSCSFERIYFSRGSDPDIYAERKKLGQVLAPQVLKAIDYDLQNTVFSYIPNTAETAFLGLVKSMDDYVLSQQQEATAKGISLMVHPRVEKLVIKDAKLRTFITEDAQRDDLVSHIYDTTYEVINKHQDTIVVIDDSIVRGTTLEKSILTMLDRLQPKRVIIVSSAPQIRYPDCYGIDMSRIQDFVAFRAMLALLEDNGKTSLLQDVYQQCKEALSNGTATKSNYVKHLYDQFSDDDISVKIGQIVTPSNMVAGVTVIYQTVENLHKACPDHLGAWYFTGIFPTPGGNKVVNTALVNFMEGKTGRSYC